jgi:hypothetical protein
VGLPEFSSATEGWLVVTVADPIKPHVDLFTTGDAGKTWERRETVSIDPALNPASLSASVLLDGNRWLLANPGKPAIFSLQPGAIPGQTPAPALPVSTLPEGVAKIIDSSPSFSWALVQEGDCRGYKPKPGVQPPSGSEPFRCSSSTSLWQTTDGGATWEDITPGPTSQPGNQR